jgi:hypothetical protein
MNKPGAGGQLSRVVVSEKSWRASFARRSARELQEMDR